MLDGVIPKRSHPSRTALPKSEALESGELAINFAEPAMYAKNDLGEVVKLAPSVSELDDILKPKASVVPSNNGDMVFQLTDNTTLVIKVKGSDGVIRSATLTLT